VPPNFFAQGYNAKWISSTNPGTEDLYYDVVPGQDVVIETVLENIGTKEWRNDQTGQPCNAVTWRIFKEPGVNSAPDWTGYEVPGNQNYGKSYFYHPSWKSEYQLVSFIDDSNHDNIVQPGEQARYRLTFHIPIDSPTEKFREDIRLSSGSYWMKNTVNGDPIGAMHIWFGFDVQPLQQRADFNNDGKLDCADVAIIQNALFVNHRSLDLTNDGWINVYDVQRAVWYKNNGGNLLGDINRDGKTDDKDVQIIADNAIENYRSTDLNNDGSITMADFDLFSSVYTGPQNCAPSSTLTPTAI